MAYVHSNQGIDGLNKERGQDMITPRDSVGVSPAERLDVRLKMSLGPTQFRWLINLYPPYVGAGVRITHVASDWRRLDVQMSLRFYNRNAVGTHFGGSLYTMVDPHAMLLLMRCLGREYMVWDRRASIEFRKPGRGTVKARIEITDTLLDEIRRHTDGGDKYFAELDIPILDAEGDVVASVHKQIYVRRKPRPGNQT